MANPVTGSSVMADAQLPGAPPVAALQDRPKVSLSPSRAGDFMSCPLRYRFRTIDQLPEPPGPEAVRGTVVHSVLERIFDAPAGRRTPEAAHGLLPEAWASLVAESPEVPGLIFGGEPAWRRWIDQGELTAHEPQQESQFLTRCAEFLDRYFALEDPNRLEPAEREKPVSVELPSGLVLRGIIDRVDRAPGGQIRVVDYKTGRAPAPGWEGRALFQMRFYGLVLMRLTGTMPARLMLLYLGSGDRLIEDPTEAAMASTEKKVQALWDAIERASSTGQWQAKRSKLCGWCSFKDRCPAWSDQA